ncbi:MAG: ABC transporter ATP-binding protein [Pseudobdellovibrionaceae bacterium]
MSNLLEMKNISVQFSTSRGPLIALRNVSLSVAAGESLGIVGESGSGKSVTSYAIMGLLPPNGKVITGDILFEGKSLLAMNEREKSKIRGSAISMIFQDPMSSLNPAFNVGYQLEETLLMHNETSRESARAKARELLGLVGIPDPEERLKAYPHQLSGGMSQRVMIAMAIACKPKLLIADEPTTALDVTIQAQILSLLRKIQKEQKMSMILISHDLALISENTSRVAVMYAGEVAEVNQTEKLVQTPAHPYTEALLKSLPAYSVAQGLDRLPAIAGVVPDLVHRPNGCQLHPRCPYAQEKCKIETPALAGGLHQVSCFYPRVAKNYSEFLAEGKR